MARQTEVMPKFGRFLIAESSETVQTGAYSGSQWGAFWWTLREDVLGGLCASQVRL